MYDAEKKEMATTTWQSANDNERKAEKFMKRSHKYCIKDVNLFPGNTNIKDYKYVECRFMMQ